MKLLNILLKYNEFTPLLWIKCVFLNQQSHIYHTYEIMSVFYSTMMLFHDFIRVRDDTCLSRKIIEQKL